MEELKEKARKELDRAKAAMTAIEVLDKQKTKSLMTQMRSYYDDGEYFFNNGNYLDALEAAFIVWAYIDAGLHLHVFDIKDEKILEDFTA